MAGMNLDFTAVGEILKDKFGRKQIICLATLTALSWLVSTVTEVAEKRLGLYLIAGVGVIGIVAQLVMDYLHPRDAKPKE